MNFRSIHFLIKDSQDRDFPELLSEISTAYRVSSFTIYNSSRPTDSRKLYPNIEFYKQEIESCKACGIINESTVFVPSLFGFTDNAIFNGCLNRKISINESGTIKNCPSTREDYGNINNKSLMEVADSVDFQKYWTINKDSISICKDCEHIYMHRL